MDRHAKGTGAIELAGVAFATVPFAEVAFATLGDAFAELAVHEAFATVAVVYGVGVVGVVRVVLPCVVVGFATLEAGTNNPVVTVGPSCVAVFPGNPSGAVSKQ